MLRQPPGVATPVELRSGIRPRKARHDFLANTCKFTVLGCSCRTLLYSVEAQAYVQ